MNYIHPLKYIENSANNYPNDIAFIVGEKKIDYKNLDRLVKELAVKLKESGMRPGDIVVALMGNSIEYVITLFAALENNAIVFPVSPKAKEAELDLMFGKLQVDFLISSSKNYLEGFDFGARKNIGLVGVVEFNDNNLSVDEVSRNENFVTENSGEKTDKAMIMTSSGTTGVPKLMYLDYEYLDYTLRISSESFNFEKEVMLGIVPPQHFIFIATVLVTLFWGSTMVLFEDFIPSVVLDTWSKMKANSLVISPFILNILVEAFDENKYDVFSMKRLIIGSSPMSQSVYEKARDRLKIDIYVGYGAIEASVISYKKDNGIYERGCVGTVSPYVKVKVFDDNGNEVKAGEIGHVGIFSKALIDGYLNNEEANKKLYFGDYLILGDNGFFTEEGILFLSGRTSMAINVAGKKVDPVEVEDVLNSHPDIVESVVYGFIKESTEIVHAKIITKKQDFSVSDIQEHCRKFLSDYKIPKKISLIEEIPRTKVGKIARSEIIKD